MRGSVRAVPGASLPVESGDWAGPAGFEAPPERLDQAQRIRVLHPFGMQKAALVTSSRSGTTWRLASDEGDYLDAVDSAPVIGLLRGELENAFALALDGGRLEVDRVAELDAPLLDAEAHRFEEIPRDAGEQDPPLGRNTGRTTPEFTGDRGEYTGGASSSLAAERDHVLHLRGRCTLRDDGVKSVEVELYSPRGSVFELLSDEPEGYGGRGRAPDATTYVAAGPDFRFMTQFGRYADVLGTELSDYRTVQDTHFSGSAAGGRSGEPARTAPVETHVILRSPRGGLRPGRPRLRRADVSSTRSAGPT